MQKKRWDAEEMSMPEQARKTPDKAAYIDPDAGETLTYGELNERSIKLAHLLRRQLDVGDRFSLLLENQAAYVVGAWAARRSGLRFVPVNWHLGPDEATYIVQNSDSRALLSCPHLSDLARAVAERTPDLQVLLSAGEAFGRFEALDTAIAHESADPPLREREGLVMFYSSGTTGQPKGVLKPLRDVPFGTPNNLERNMVDHFGFDEATRFYTSAPIYHGAPTGWTMGTLQIGATAVIARRFDAEATLRHVQDYKITHAQFVPTHFIRLLKLPQSVRRSYDLSSLRMVVHAAAPCPVDVKERMMEWWGPIIHEYYGQSEGGCMTAIGPQDWMAHKGSVGRAVLGSIHIVDDDGRLLEAGRTGHLMFDSEEVFEYHKEPEKTAASRDERGWVRPGDMGWMDPDGYLYLTDRASNMIISGGVNIYPQEVEGLLALHPGIRDVAVIGVPDDDFGEQVKAVVEVADGFAANAAFAHEIIGHCQQHLAKFKCPKTVDFVAELPRLPTGKLLKRELRKRYWPQGQAL